MISQDTILTALWTLLTSSTAVTTVCGASSRVVKGMKRPDGLANPCITVAMPVLQMPGGHWTGTNVLARTQRGPILINVFADNADNGAIDYARLNTITTAVGSLLAASKPAVAGASVHRTGQYIVSGPLWDSLDPHEAYQVMQVGFWINET